MQKTVFSTQLVVLSIKFTSSATDDTNIFESITIKMYSFSNYQEMHIYWLNTSTKLKYVISLT